MHPLFRKQAPQTHSFRWGQCDASKTKVRAASRSGRNQKKESTMTCLRNFERFLRASLLAMIFVTVAGCGSLKEGLSKAVLMDYDQTTNFRQYKLLPINYIQWGGGASETGIDGYYPGSPTVRGFWAVFIICNVRNEGSAAENFPFKMENFYVTYDGQDHYYKPLAAYTFSSYPNNLWPTAGITSQVNEKFRQETNLGPETDTFSKNSYAPSVNYRFAIHVTRSTPGAYDIDTPMQLRYKNYPNIMNNRNQLPQMKANPSEKADLATVCRPPA
jgi:hypothetical protein